MDCVSTCVLPEQRAFPAFPHVSDSPLRSPLQLHVVFVVSNKEEILLPSRPAHREIYGVSIPHRQLFWNMSQARLARFSCSQVTLLNSNFGCIISATLLEVFSLFTLVQHLCHNHTLHSHQSHRSNTIFTCTDDSLDVAILYLPLPLGGFLHLIWLEVVQLEYLVVMCLGGTVKVRRHVMLVVAVRLGVFFFI